MLTHVRLTAGQEKSQIIVEWLRNVEMLDQTKRPSNCPLVVDELDLVKALVPGHYVKCSEMP